jgi:hypothetical protein
VRVAIWAWILDALLRYRSLFSELLTTPDHHAGMAEDLRRGLRRYRSFFERLLAA